MTEAEWLASDDPQQMLAQVQGHVSARRLRLFAVACCRAVWDGRECPTCDTRRMETLHDERTGRTDHMWCRTCHGAGRLGGLTDPRSRQVVEMTEWYADGLATEEEFREVTEGPGYPEIYAAAWCCLPDASEAAREVSRRLLAEVSSVRLSATAQAALVRDIVGNPWRPKTLPLGEYLRFDGDEIRSTPILSRQASPWLCWNGGTVLHLAQSIYDARAFDRMALLGDALEDAGCCDREILEHCRGGGPHVKGCWLIDLLLGKE